MNLGNWETYTTKAIEFANMMGRDFGSLKDQEASVQSSVLLLHVAVSGLANAIQDASKADDKKALQAMLKTLRDKEQEVYRHILELSKRIDDQNAALLAAMD
jgi:hypothetical protein